MKTVGDLCVDLTTGATNTLFDKASQESDSSLRLLMGSSLNSSGEILEEQLDFITLKEGKDESRFLLQQGDVVLLAKGNSIRAGYVTEYIAKLSVIASANFIVLRPNKKELLGEVLVAYFNSPAGQSLLEATSTGATIKNISLSNLKKLEIPLPSLSKQHKVAELFHASNQAYRSTMNLAEQQKKVADACISKLIKGAA